MKTRLFRLLFWSALIFALVMANLAQPPVIEGADDKSLHMLAFAVLAALIAPAYPRASLWLLFLALAIFGGVIEFMQSLAGLGRQADFHDWIADIIAAGGVLLAIGLMRAVMGPRAEQVAPRSQLPPDNDV